MRFNEPQLNTIENLKELQEFMQPYKAKLEPKYLKYIYKDLYDIGLCLDQLWLQQILREFMDLPDKYNTFKGFMEILKTNFDLNYYKIVELGGQIYPANAREIGKYSGTITTYDPNFIVDKMENVILKKELIDEQTDLSIYDLFISILPCEGTKIAIEKCIQYNLEYFIVLCDCLFHGEEYESSIGCNDWQEDILQIAHENLSDDKVLIKGQITKKYGYPYKYLLCKNKNKSSLK